MKYFLFFIFCISVAITKAQIGINTNQPKAQLQVSAKNLVSGELDTGFGVPLLNNFPEINPTAEQNGMLIYLDTTSVSNATGYYYWDAATTSWEFMLDNVSKDLDTSKTIVLGTKFSPSNIGGTITRANVPFEYITTLDASFELSNGGLKVGKTSTYYLTFSGGVVKDVNAAVFDYSTEILINGNPSNNLTSTNSAPANGGGNTRSATFYIATVLNFNKNDIITVRTTKTSGTPNSSQVSVDTPYTLTLINMK